MPFPKSRVIITDEMRYRIFMRMKVANGSGETATSIGALFGVSDRTVRRIFQECKEHDLRIKAGLPEPLVEPQSKPRHRVRAWSRVLKPRPLTAIEELDQARAAANKVRSLAVPAPDYPPLVPIGGKVSPVKLVRRHGSLEHVTGDAALIVLDPDGTAVKVIRCPMYDPRSRMISRETVEITSIDSIEVRGKTVQEGSISRWSGETITGTLVFHGIRGKDKVQISRVEFHPDVLPAEYVREHKEMRARLG